MCLVRVSGEMHCPETNSQQLVAVKVLKENVSNEIREDFEREVEIMSAFDHDNILKLVGVVTQSTSVRIERERERGGGGGWGVGGF